MLPIHYSRKEYREDYLSSQEWRDKSAKILARDPICKICDKTPSVDAHHLTYERITQENLDTDLIGVCRKCHNRIHKYRELEDISSFYQLKVEFERSKKPFLVKEGIVLRLKEANVSTQQKIAGILKIRIEEFDKLKNRKWGYFLARKILRWLNNPIKEGAFRSKGTTLRERKEYRERRKKSLLRKGFGGRGGILKI